MKIYKKISLIMLGMLLVLGVLTGLPTKSEAAPSPITNARTHYNTYGEQIKYFSDGTIRYAERYTTGEYQVMTRVMGYRVTMTVGGASTSVDYSGGYSTAPFNVRTNGFRTIEAQYSGYEYVVYVFDFDQLVANARAKNATVASRLASGDYDVQFEFDGISEIYLDKADGNRRIFGPKYTKADTQQMFRDYNAQNHLSKNDSWGSHHDIDINILDWNYDIRFTVSKSELPTVDYVNKGISFPNGGGYNSSGSTYYVNLNKKVKINTQYRGNNVDLVTQPLLVGDLQGSANAVDDFIATWNHGSGTFSLNTSGNVTWHGGDSSGKRRPNADTTSSANYVFEFDREGGTWYVQSEARNEVNVYEGGDVADYRHLYTLYPDGTAPTIGGRLPATWRNTDGTFSAVVQDPGSGIKNIKYYRGSTLIQEVSPSSRDTAYTLNSQTATSSQTYRAIMTDNVGNTTTADWEINIDKIDPTLSATASPSGWTNGNVSISYSASDTGGSGFDYIRLPNGTTTTSSSGSYTATSSGTYSFTAYDNAGNTTTKTVTANIDKTDPTANLSQTPTSWTNGNVTLNLTSISDSGGSGFDYVRLPNGTIHSSTSNVSQSVSTNGTYTFTLYDNAGNDKSLSITVSNIDKVAPTGTLTQSPSGSSVLLTLSSITDVGSGVRSVELPNGTIQSGTSNKTYSVTSNGTYTFTIEDNAGNTTNRSITVTSIDGIAPTASLSQTPTSWTNGNVTLNLTSISDTGGSGLASVRLPNGTVQTSFENKAYVVTSNGSYSFVISDNAGNKTTKSITVTNIDKTAPSFSLSQNPTSWTNGTVTLNVTSISDTGGSGIQSLRLPNGNTVNPGTSYTYPVTANGTYSFGLEDDAGNMTTRSITVSNIDKAAPSGTLSQTPTSWTNGNVTLNLSGVSDTGGSGFKHVVLPNGTVSTNSSASQVVSTNGTYEFDIVDNAGNTTTRSITVSNIDKTAPSLNNPTQTPTTWTNNSVTVNVSGATDTGGSGFKHIVLPNGTITTATSASQVVTANGTYTFKAVDNAGNETSKSITVGNIDKIVPTSNNPTQTPTAPTNGNVTISLSGATDTGGSGFKHIELPNGTVVTTTSASQIVTDNGSYTFEIHDNAGNISTKTIVVTNIYKAKPSGDIVQTPTSWTNGTVTLNLNNIWHNGTGVKRILLPNGVVASSTSSASYGVTANGTYTFTIEDNVGNVTLENITVTNIEKIAPTGTLTQTPTAWTNGNVTLNLTGVADTGGSGLKSIKLPNGTIVTGTSASQAVTSNGTYTFEMHDHAGNIGTRSITVSNIEKVAPTATLTQSPTTPTNGNVTLTLSAIADTGGSGLKSVTLPNGTTETTFSNKSVVVSTNGTYSFVIEDHAGNESTRSITVSNIDKVAPTGTLNQNTTAWTNGNVTLNLTGVADTGGSGLKQITLPNGTVVTGTSASQAVSANGTYVFRIEDNAGNETSKSIVVTNIDKSNPTAILSQTPTTWTNGNVTLNLTGVSDTGGSGVKHIELPNGNTVTTPTASHVVTANGTYTFEIQDNAGNVTTRSITVSNIDKSAPTGTVAQTPTTWTNGNVTLNLTGVSDTGGSGVKQLELPNGNIVTTPTASHVVTANGTYTFEIQDNAGNVTTRSITVANIDKTSPTGTLSQNPSTPTNGNVTLTIVADTDGGGSGFKHIKRPDGVMVSNTTTSQVVTTNGSYVFEIHDHAGNITLKTINVTNIDKSAPTGTISQTPLTWTNQTVTINLTGVSDSGGSGLKHIKKPDGAIVTGTSASHIVTANGTYTFEILDYAGNTTSRSITVSNIEKVAPTATLTQAPTTWTNGSVTLTLSSIGDTGGSALKSVTYPDGTVETTFTNKSYVVASNGTYSFKVEDNAGNETVKTISVTNIDKTAPTANAIVATPTSWTNGDVILSLTGAADTGGSGLKHIILPNGSIVTGSSATQNVSANGTYVFKILDTAGNETVKSISVNNIDKALPTATLSQTPTTWTNGNVTLNLSNVADTGGSGLKSIKLPNGKVETTIGNKSFVVTSNGSYSFEIEDIAGNVTQKTLNVTNIDKVNPSGSVSTIAGTTQLTLRFVGADDSSGVDFIILPNGVQVSALTGDYSVTAPGLYMATIVDRAGNRKDVSIRIESPSITIAREKNGWTNVSGYNLTASGSPRYGSSLKLQSPFTGGAWMSQNTLSARITKNGTYTFNVNDGGIPGTATIVIDNFDRALPIVNIQEKSRTETSVDVNIKVEDIGDTK
ncbi:hypothetical protein JMA_41100 (plasmid) [Jeotgalibacillus malaysiensis]|uniref:Uncharacterized protein n=1 Tax=Jeotgalibacillus malaysiensis TaxID=1508404 RepID=A0A0B5ARW4_9BACL|nr:hypothetical protein [Jeotgalibacillus malaysiensis]AJD93015.1 hypothetical protein JMA_41100 [Jeotgalibacillus malaysiensis]